MLAVLAGGCGLITPQSLLIKGGVWVAKKGVEQFEENVKHDREKSAQDKRDRGSSRQRPASQPTASTDEEDVNAR